jgi:pimeloyl-ACP methyl ester carboxylesterase
MEPPVLQPLPQGWKPAPYEDRYLDARGSRMHYLDYGGTADSTILCLHGGQAHAHWYDFMAGEFTQRHRVIALEHKGHGDSAWTDPPAYTYNDFADDVAAAVEQLGLNRFTLIGHSIGGVVGLTYAARHPGRVANLILVDSTLQMAPARLARFQREAALPAQTWATREALIADYKLNPPETQTPAEIVRYLGWHVAMQRTDGTWQQRFDRKVYTQRDWTNEFAPWSAISIPVMLVKGALSNRITPEIVTAVKARCPQAGLVTVANSDHHVMLDNPEDFARVVRDFVAAHPIRA